VKIGFGSSDWSLTVKDQNGHPVWGGSGFIRLGQYAPLLRHDVVVGPLCWHDGVFGVKDWDGQIHLDCDIVVMQRVMFEDIPEKMNAAKALGQVIVNDIDDWYWGLSPSNGAFAASHPKNNPKENTNHYRSILARSTVVTTSTRFLADKMTKWVGSDRVTILPNCVKTEMFDQHIDSGSEVPTVGWVGSTAHRSGDLEILKGVVGPLADRGLIKLHHSGHLTQHPLFADRIGVDPSMVSTLPMAAPENYPSILQFDIGLAPLSKMPFNRAKSAIKLLEYSAAGIPAVVSDLDAYVEAHDEYGLGFIAKNPSKWIKHIERLRNPEFRKEQGELARANVAQCDVKFGAERMSSFYESLV
jgi:glycosyltransferase involved in cell wall biosynthesis